MKSPTRTGSFTNHHPFWNWVLKESSAARLLNPKGTKLSKPYLCLIIIRAIGVKKKNRVKAARRTPCLPKHLSSPHSLSQTVSILSNLFARNLTGNVLQQDISKITQDPGHSHTNQEYGPIKDTSHQRGHSGSPASHRNVTKLRETYAENSDNTFPATSQRRKMQESEWAWTDRYI